MKKDWRDLCEVKKLFKEERKGETEPYNKMLLGKIYHVIRKVDG